MPRALSKAGESIASPHPSQWARLTKSTGPPCSILGAMHADGILQTASARGFWVRFLGAFSGCVFWVRFLGTFSGSIGRVAKPNRTLFRGPVHRVGIDENGLGPRLGPLIVTAVRARTEGAGHELVRKRPRGSLAKRLGDSKAFVSFQDVTLGEAWARAVFARHAGPNTSAATPDKLIQSISLDRREALTERCPDHHSAQCWATEGETFDADDALISRLSKDLDALADKGVSVLGAEVAIVCTERLNDGVSRGYSRFDVDLHTMERLALSARAKAGTDIEVTCGKVGGYDKYTSAFGPLSGHLHTAICEGRARSEYRVLGLGHIAFVRDADADHLLVCMASLIGKWVREVLMARVTRYHRAYDPSLPEASGYHDPVTTRFIQGSALARRSRRISDDCFERRKLPEDSA
jgi:ribonuclease HII